MKKIIYFIIPIMFVLLFGSIITFLDYNSLSPLTFWWFTFLLIGSILLSLNFFWGAFIGAMPAIHWIYMSTQDTGQAINIELPLGIIVLIFYFVCGIYVYRLKMSKMN